MSTKSTEKSFVLPRGSPILGFKVSLSVFFFYTFLLFFLLRVQLSRQLLQVPGRDDAVIGDERLDDEEAFIFIVSSLLLLLPVLLSINSRTGCKTASTSRAADDPPPPPVVVVARKCFKTSAGFPFRS